MVRVPEYRRARTFCSEHREAVRILGAFANLQKATISSMSVRLSFRVENSAPNRRILMKFDI